MRLLIGGLLFGMALGAQAQNGLTTEERARLDGLGTVTTHATSTTRLPNTVADVTVGVQVTGNSVAAAADLLAQKSDTLTHYLRSVNADRLSTGEVSFEPQNHTAKNGVESIVGYTGSITVSLRTSASSLGGVLAGALANGANRIESTLLHPSEKEADAARRSLAEEATRRALAEAEAVTRAAGERVVAVSSISVDQPVMPVRPYALAAMDKMRAAAPAPPIAVSAGDAELSVSVSVAVTITK